MKTLTLLRHAKSSWDDHATRDFDRPLTARGRRAAHAVGAEMHRLGLRFDRVFASPAVRIVETLRNAEQSYGQSFDPVWERRIYLASMETLLELIQSVGDGDDSLLLVGHSPGLEDLALRLSAPGPLREEIAIKYPTAALAQIEFSTRHWAELREGGGTLTRFTRPRDLDPELGPDEAT